MNFLLIDIINTKTYCVKCKTNTDNIDSKIFRTKNYNFRTTDYLCNQNVVNVKIKHQDL